MVLPWRKQKTSEDFFGLDIGSDFVKLTRIGGTSSSYEVKNFIIAPVPKGAIIKDEIKDYPALVAVLKKMLAETAITTKNVAIAIPRSLALIKNITVDARLNEREIESRAWIEANRYFPDLVGEIYLDFIKMGLSPDDPSHLELVLVACRKEHVKPYLEILNQVGLVPKIVDINCYALERVIPLLTSEPSSQAIGLLNLDLGLSSFIVVQNNQMLYAHDHNFDAHQLVVQVQEFWKVNNTQAFAEDPAYIALLKANLTSHIRHTLHFFYSSRPTINIHQLILAGDCATIPDLADFIKQESNIETIIADPFRDMKLADTVATETLKTNAPAFTLSCGLALSALK